MRTAVTKDKVLNNVLKLTKKEGRPVHLADLRKSLTIYERRDPVKRRGKDGKARRITKALYMLFNEGRISRSESLARVEHYPASPYAGVDTVTTNVYFYGPVEYAGKYARFKLNGSELTLRFVTCDMAKPNGDKTKKEMVLEVLNASDRALTVNEILERINEKYDAYDVSDKKKFYNATTSLTKAVLKPLRKEGLQGEQLNRRWIWYFTEEQLAAFKDYYVKNDTVLNFVEGVVKRRGCIPLSRVISDLQVSPDEAKWKIKGVAKFIGVKIHTKTVKKKTRVDWLELMESRRESFIGWLGYVVPKSKDDEMGYETMLVYLDSDWQEELTRQIDKSLSRISQNTTMGIFYEKLVARLFDIICTSEELHNSELSRYMIPFVFRDERVTNVWITMESGRKGEFDVLIRGTFTAFNVMARDRPFLDIIIPIESKYRKVKAEHVISFDDKIRSIFRGRRNIIPIMVGLAWTKEALALTRRFGVLTIYFSDINRLVREMTGTKYRFEHEWDRVEESMEEGELSIEVLRRRLKKNEFRFIFEEYIEKKISCASSQT